MQAEPQLRESLGKRIRRLRKERGLSQIALSEIAGVTDTWISQVEQDKAKPSAQLLHAIATALQVPIHELLQEDITQIELVTRMKLVEVLLETKQTQEADSILLGLASHPELGEAETAKLTLFQAESKYLQRQYDKALALLLPLIETLELNNFHDVRLLAEIRNKIGATYYLKRHFTEAYHNYRKALEYTSRLGEFDFLAARISYNVGATLRTIGHSDDAIPYFEKSYAFFKKNNQLRNIAFTLWEQGIAYKNNRNFSRAIECFDQAHALLQGLNLIYYAVLVQANVASEITVLENPELAIEQLQNVTRLAKEQHINFHCILALCKMARIQLKLEQIDAAHVSLQEAEELLANYDAYESPEAALFYQVSAQYQLRCQNPIVATRFALKSAKLFGQQGLMKDQLDSLQIVVSILEPENDAEQLALLKQYQGQ